MAANSGKDAQAKQQKINETTNLLWIATSGTMPSQARGKLDLSISPNELRSVVEAVLRGEDWGIDRTEESVITRLALPAKDWLELKSSADQRQWG